MTGCPLIDTEYMGDSVSIRHLILKIRGKARAVPGEYITAGILSEIAGPDDLVRRAGDVKIRRAPDNPGQAIVVSGMDVVRAVIRETEAVHVSLHGEDETVVLIEKPDENRQAKSWPAVTAATLRLAAICIILFIGSALAIMNFHADVEMSTVLTRIYRMFTGEVVSRPPLLVILPYSLGVGLGITVFFNHLPFSGRRREPSPLEIEVYLYDQSVQRCTAAQEEERAANSRSEKQEN
jgi:stage V sporulation protein AA